MYTLIAAPKGEFVEPGFDTLFRYFGSSALFASTPFPALRRRRVLAIHTWSEYPCSLPQSPRSLCKIITNPVKFKIAYASVRTLKRLITDVFRQNAALGLPVSLPLHRRIFHGSSENAEQTWCMGKCVDKCISLFQCGHRVLVVWGTQEGRMLDFAAIVA